MSHFLEESYKSRDWNVSEPRTRLTPFNEPEVCPIPVSSFEHLSVNDKKSFPAPTGKSLSPFEDSISESNRDVSEEIEIDSRPRGRTVEDGYYFLETFEKNERLLYPQTMRQQNIRIDDIALYVHHSQHYFNPKHHPESKLGKMAYKVVYYPAMYMFDWFMSMFLLALALIEYPFFEPFRPYAFQLKITAYVLEAILILYFILDLGLRFIWLGRKRFLRQKIAFSRVIGVALITLDFILALAVEYYYRHRFLRIFRPIIFLSSHLNRNIRNVVNQLLNSVRRIFDLYVLYIVYVLIFSLLAYYLLYPIDHKNYPNFPQTFITLFALSTTVNYPDVMLPALKSNLLYFLLFLPFLSFGIYVLTNLLLAIVKDHFSRLEKDKLKQLLQFRRVSLERAFNLGTQLSGNEWDYSLFRRVMRSMPQISPISEKKCLLMFKVLDRNLKQKLSWKEFNQLSNALSLKWRRGDLTNINKIWHNMIPIRRLRRVAQYTYIMVSSFYFKLVINLIILSNCLLLLIDTLVYLNPEQADRDDRFRIESGVFLPLYFIEFVLQIIGFGPFYYFTNGWHLFDFCILFFSSLVTIISLFYSGLDVTLSTSIIVLRTFRLLRVLKAKESFRRIFAILTLSIPKLTRFVISLGLAFYCYAIIGMTIYADMLKECSFNDKGLPEFNSECGVEYDSNSGGLYYLVNFDDILHSFITLFVLMIVNNWQVVAKGYIAVTNFFSYLFFIFFYLFIVLVITNVTAAFVLDLYDSISSTLGKSFSVRVTISKEELEKYDVYENVEGAEVEYVGKKKLGQFDSLMLLYQSEDWVQKDQISPIGDFYIQN